MPKYVRLCACVSIARKTRSSTAPERRIRSSVMRVPRCGTGVDANWLQSPVVASVRALIGDPGGTRTPDQEFRKLLLYPPELRGHAGANQNSMTTCSHPASGAGMHAVLTSRAVELLAAFSHTGWVGKSVLAILLLFSLISWAVMYAVWQRFRRSSRASRQFMSQFRRAKRLADVQSALPALAHSSLVGLFR